MIERILKALLITALIAGDITSRLRVLWLREHTVLFVAVTVCMMIYLTAVAIFLIEEDGGTKIKYPNEIVPAMFERRIWEMRK